MNPFGTILPAAETVTKTVNTELLPLMREIVAKLVLYGDQWSANDVMGEIAAAEALVNVENGEIAVYGGYDTNDIRRWNALFASFMAWKATNITTTLAGGTTEIKTAETMVIRFYAPVE